MLINPLTADELRSRYLNFFRERGHTILPSFSLVPENDPSVLFTTAGMHPLVPYLLGQPHPAGKRLTDCQKCIRTGDIEDVGDATHLTFFEMLGNWSLGDYFKRESITWSYEFLTREDCLGIPESLLYVSVFEGNAVAPRDEEAAEIWQSLGIPLSRISFLSAEHNWWAAGAEGPCGPDTEIFVDTTDEACIKGSNCVAGLCKCGRWFEIWNNVFMSYSRKGDTVTRLEVNNVDTGMGLERTLAVLNGVESVYETSAFRPLVERLLADAGRSWVEMHSDPKSKRLLRILADHLRSAVFILGDEKGVTPSNQGQGYVLRRLIRRAIRVCSQFGLSAEQWVAACQTVVEHYGHVYPGLQANGAQIREELQLEHERFQKTLSKGTTLIEEEVNALRAASIQILPGEVAFRLFDTYGFPIEFTREIAAEKGLAVDLDDYKVRVEENRAKSRSIAAKSGLADDSAESVRYHTATHLLHAGLRHVLGEHATQKGSNITRERLRFDFSHPRPMTKEEVAQVEKFVQDAVNQALPVSCEVLSYEEAKESGAIGLFNDRYGNDVTVYTIGDISKELCAGPHVSNTRELGKFRIEKEQSCSAGVRRIRAVLK